MCPGPRTAMPTRMPKQEQPSSLLLEFAAADDLVAFRRAVQEDNLSLVAASSWYGPSAKGPARLSLQLRTPAMIAALYGSTQVLSYVLSIAPSEAARASATDGATPLQLAAAGGAASALAATHLLIAAGSSPPDARASSGVLADSRVSLAKSPRKQDKKKDYGGPPDQAALPDMDSGVFATDEFRMYSFKVNPCSRAYTHDWTECPFAHPGENARRRDPRRFSYTCVPCPDFRKDPASCRKGDACEYAHGVFESWLHPAQYRTRLCKDEVGCPRRICFFAHTRQELRAVNPSAMSMSSSPPRNNFPSDRDVDLGASRARPVLKTSMSSRELDFDLDQYKQQLLLGSLTAPRTSPDYSDLIGYVSRLQAMSLQKAGGDSMPSSHKPPLGRPMSSRAAAFANRSQSFVERAPATRSFASPTTTSMLSDWGSPDGKLERAPATRSFLSPATMSPLADWGSPDGKLDWGVQGAELRKSASFGIRSTQTAYNTMADVSWASSLGKDGSDMLAARWSDLEQMVA